MCRLNGNYGESVKGWNRRIGQFPVGNPNPYVYLAAAQTLLGKTEDAAATAVKLRKLYPKFRLSTWRYIDTFRSSENRERLYNAAKRAGVPE